LKPQVVSSNSVGQVNHADDHAIPKAAAGNAARTAAITARPGWRDEPASRISNEPRSHARASQVAAAKARPGKHQWRSHSEIVTGQCACGPWQIHQVVYEPPRNVVQ
jgi:hypothetical protein